MYYQKLEEAVAVKNYLRDQLGEVHSRVVSFQFGHAVQRYKSGTYWASFSAACSANSSER